MEFFTKLSLLTNLYSSVSTRLLSAFTTSSSIAATFRTGIGFIPRQVCPLEECSSLTFHLTRELLTSKRGILVFSMTLAPALCLIPLMSETKIRSCGQGLGLTSRARGLAMWIPAVRTEMSPQSPATSRSGMRITTACRCGSTSGSPMDYPSFLDSLGLKPSLILRWLRRAHLYLTYKTITTAGRTVGLQPLILATDLR